MTHEGQRICIDSTSMCDIVPKFMAVVREESHVEYVKLLESVPVELVHNGEFKELPDDDVLWKTDQLFWWFHEDLWNAMEALAPAGCHFGVRIIHGSRLGYEESCYGYWPEKLITKEKT